MRISVVIPVYNIEAYLNDCLDSVSFQSFQDWECVCVDDGSTDASGRILDAYALKDARFRVYHRQNTGVGSTRNFALDMVGGEYVFFLDGDDALVNEKVFELFDKMIRQIGRTMLLMFDRSDWVDGQLRPLPERFDQKVTMLNTSLLIDGRISSRSFFVGFYPRELIGNIRFPMLRIGEDRLFLAKVLMRAECVAIHPANVYAYRRRSGSAMGTYSGVRDLLDDIAWRLDVIKAYRGSGKRMSAGGLRGKALFLTEHTGFQRQKLNADDRRLLDPKWKEALRCVSRCHEFPLWNRVSATLALLFPTDFVYWILFWVPMWMKKHGVHR